MYFYWRSHKQTSQQSIGIQSVAHTHTYYYLSERWTKFSNSIIETQVRVDQIFTRVSLHVLYRTHALTEFNHFITVTRTAKLFHRNHNNVSKNYKIYLFLFYHLYVKSTEENNTLHYDGKINKLYNKQKRGKLGYIILVTFAYHEFSYRFSVIKYAEYFCL